MELAFLRPHALQKRKNIESPDTGIKRNLAPDYLQGTRVNY